MSNYTGSSAWAAARPSAIELSPRVPATLSVLGSAYPEAGRDRLSGRPGGVNTQVEQHVFARFTAAASVTQVKDTDIRMPLGPPPWSPPERKL